MAKLMDMLKNRKIFILYIAIVIIIIIMSVYFIINYSNKNANNGNDDQVEVKPREINCTANLVDKTLKADDLDACYSKEHDDNANFNVTVGNDKINNKIIKAIVGYSEGGSHSLKMYIGDKLVYNDEYDSLYLNKLSIFNNELLLIVVGKSNYVGYSNVFAFDKEGNKIYQLANDDTHYDEISLLGSSGKGVISYKVYESELGYGCANYGDNPDTVMYKTYEVNYIGNNKFGESILKETHTVKECLGQ